MNELVPKPTTPGSIYNASLFDFGIYWRQMVDTGPVIKEPVLDEGIQNWTRGSRFWSPQCETKNRHRTKVYQEWSGGIRGMQTAIAMGAFLVDAIGSTYGSVCRPTDSDS